MKLTINLWSTLYLMLIINPIFSLIFDNTTIYYHYIYLPIIYLLLGMILNKKQKATCFLVISACVALSVGVAIVFGAELGKINNQLFNFLDTIFLCVLFADSEEIDEFIKYLKRKSRLLTYIVLIINIVELYLIVTKNGYTYSYSWGGTFFHGTNSMPHTLAYLMLTTMLYVIVLELITGRQVYAILSLVPVYAIYESGARVALLLAGILGVILLNITFAKHTRSYILKGVQILIIVAALWVVFRDTILSSDVVAKINKKASSDSNSSGRIEMWIYLMQQYISHPSKWLLGFGDDAVYEFNYQNVLVNVRVWAHSDFFQTLVGKGLVGLACYAYGMFSLVKTFLRENGNLYTLMLLAYIAIAVFINGFYPYKDMSLALPFILVTNRYLYNKKLNSKKIDGEKAIA